MAAMLVNNATRTTAYGNDVFSAMSSSDFRFTPVPPAPSEVHPGSHSQRLDCIPVRRECAVIGEAIIAACSPNSLGLAESYNEVVKSS